MTICDLWGNKNGKGKPNTYHTSCSISLSNRALVPGRGRARPLPLIVCGAWIKPCLGKREVKATEPGHGFPLHARPFWLTLLAKPRHYTRAAGLSLGSGEQKKRWAPDGSPYRDIWGVFFRVFRQEHPRFTFYYRVYGVLYPFQNTLRKRVKVV